MAKFTPGPWKVIHQIHSDLSFDVVAPDDRGGKVVAVIGKTADTNSTIAANAALIAAAPEMLDALKDLLDSAADISMTFDGGQSDSHARLTCRCKFCALERSFLLAGSAIAKAEGVSK